MPYRRNMFTTQLDLTDVSDSTVPATFSTVTTTSITTQAVQDGTGYETVAATGNNQGTAAAVTKQFSYVTDADGTKGVILPAPGYVGRELYLSNVAVAANDLKVYPAVGGSIWPAAGNAAVVINGQTGAMFKSVTVTSWLVVGSLQA